MNRRRSSGFVLVVVIFFAVLLMSSIATFLRRATIDASIISNRDHAARAEALARGGVQPHHGTGAYLRQFRQIGHSTAEPDAN